MATRNYWNGSTGAWDTNANWSTGTKPGAGEHVIFDGRSVVSVTTGPAATPSLNSFQVLPAYTGSIGTSGSYIPVDVTSGTGFTLLKPGGTGAIYIDGPHDSVVVDSASTGAIKLKATAATIAELMVLKSAGGLTVVNGATVTTGRVSYATVAATDASVTIESGCTITDWYQAGGAVSAGSIPTNVYLASGTFTCSGATGNITLLSMQDGTFYWCSSTSATQTITTAEIMGGVLDIASCAQIATITTCRLWPAGSIVMNNGKMVTFTNAVRTVGRTLSLTVDGGFAATIDGGTAALP